MKEIICVCATFEVRWLFYFGKMLARSLDENIGEDPGSWTNVNPTLTRKSVYTTHFNFPSTLIVIFSVRLVLLTPYQDTR
jgi:hypothetical protein